MTTKTRGDTTWAEYALIGIVLVVFCAPGVYIGYRRYFSGTDAGMRQAVALERIADSLERLDR